ncbi:hypothetical protein M0R72_12105 [Candidatus Pacearchaeota archaeon]|jgi:predicted transcriptional regulator|nr:hypothetical protein [Candidatus Pacearchaeota archaeon]
MTEDTTAATATENKTDTTASLPEKKTLTQAEIDAIVEERLARDRKGRLSPEDLAKELGMSLKDAKAIIKAKKDADEAAKSELEKLTGERDSHKTDAQNARLEAIKIRALAKAGADPEKIDSLMKRVVGSTPEEIEADVLELKSLGLIGPKESIGAQGAGNPGLQKQKTGPTLDEQITAAQERGLKTGDWNAYNQLTLQKQSKG